MSNLETRPQETVTRSMAPAAGPVVEELVPREVPLGGVRAMTVRRTLPHKVRRTIGAWCFLDHYGSSTRPADHTMHVPEHPHTGLQTVTWLFDGTVRHQDSLGSDQLIRPGQLNLMTAGHGIAHAEDTASAVDPLAPMHGLQLWVALPGAALDAAPAFAHHADLPVVDVDGAQATVLVGSLAGASSARSRTRRCSARSWCWRRARPLWCPSTLRSSTGCSRWTATCGRGPGGRRRDAALPGHGSRRAGGVERLGRPRVPAGRCTAGRAARHVVELRRSLARGHRRRPRRLGGPFATLPRRPRLRRASAGPRAPHHPPPPPLTLLSPRGRNLRSSKAASLRFPTAS